MRLIALVAVVGLLATAAPAHQSAVSFNIAPGACGRDIAIPANDKPVILAGVNLQDPNRGEGQVTILHSKKGQASLGWAGVAYWDGVIRGFALAPDVHIMYLDNVALVEVRTAPSTHIKVCNSSNNDFHAIGSLTMIY